MPESLVLVERERELDRVAALIETVSDGAAGVLVLEGPAGIGKTSLAAGARERALERGLRVCFSRGSQLEREHPFGVVRQWFEPALAAASPALRGRLLEGAAGLAEPVVSPLAQPAEQRPSPAILHGLYWLTANLAAAGPLLLVVDDAQWADESSLRLLCYLAARVEGLAVGLLVACRPPEPDEGAGLLSQLLADHVTEVVHPQALSAEGVARLLAARYEREPDRGFVDACVAATGGNPFYLGQLVGALAEEGISPTGDQVDRVAMVSPASVSRAVLTRLSRPAQWLARALAVLDEPAQPRLAAELAGLEDPAARAAAAELAHAGLVAEGGPLALVHPIVAAAILSSLSEAARSDQHARAARLLRVRGATAERVAGHLLASAPAADPRVVHTLRDAAREALSRGAPEVAIRLLRRALDEPPASDNRVEVLFELGAVERHAGLPEAVDHLAEVHRSAADAVVRAQALEVLAWALGPDPRAIGRLLADVDHAITDVSALDRELALGLEAIRIGGLWLAPDAREEAAARFERLGALEGKTPGECVLLAMLARYLMDCGRPASDVAEAAERALGDPRTLELQGTDSLWLGTCVVALRKAERFESLESLLGRALDMAHERGFASGFASASAFRALLALDRGTPRDAEADARAALESGTLSSEARVVTSASLIEALLEQGKLDAAQAVYEQTGMGEQLPDRRMVTPLLISRGMLRHAQGEPERALADLREAVKRIARYAAGTPAGMDARLLIVSILHQLGRGEQALDAAEEALAIARSWGADGLLGQALRAHALVVGGEEGLGQLQQAVELLAGSPLQLKLARAQLDLGAALRRAGRRADSRQPLRAALDYAERVGAAPVARRAREELAASGIRVPRQRVGDELTPSEQRIVQIAATGATNPQIAQALFITTKTVESHLANAYRKLDISSRRELPRALAALARADN
jgi:DNA-binding CsgD family transcriptional regulator